MQNQDVLDTASSQKAAGDAKTVSQKQTAAQIREALSLVDDGEKPVLHPPHQPLPPLRRRGEARSERVKNAAAETVVTPVKPLKPLKASRPAQEASGSSDMPQLRRTAKVGSSADAAGKTAHKKPASAASAAAAPGKTAAKKKKGTAKPAAKKKKVSTLQQRFGVTPGLVALTVCGGVLVAAIASYVIVAVSYKGKFLPNTYVNHINVAGMTEEEAKETLLTSAAISSLHLMTPAGKDVTFTAEDFGGQYSIPAGSLEEAESEGAFLWLDKLLHPSEYQIDLDFSFSEEKLKAAIAGYDWGSAKSHDACIVRSGSGVFEIQPETYGDEFDQDILTAYVSTQLKAGVTTVTMKDSGCYEKYLPSVTADDLGEELDLYNRLASCTITYDFEDRTKVVDGDMIVSWMMLNEDGSVKTDTDGNILFNVESVSNFVAEMAAETDTVGKDRKFHATVDGDIIVPWTGYPYSVYGWQINQTDTINQLLGLLRKGETVKVEPEYTQRGYVRTVDDIGKTYVEADISEQHMWVYIKGVVVLESDFVSGTETNPGRRTPRGVCEILSREKGRYLGTVAVQGYHTWVDYWMPFNNWGCGFHDLSRSAYGGSIYMYNGSHGCINLSHSFAEQLFNTVETGMPVLIHD